MSAACIGPFPVVFAITVVAVIVVHVVTVLVSHVSWAGIGTCRRLDFSLMELKSNEKFDVRCMMWVVGVSTWVLKQFMKMINS